MLLLAVERCGGDDGVGVSYTLTFNWHQQVYY